MEKENYSCCKDILGIRLNNPLCIRYSKANMWCGQIGNENGFCRFDKFSSGVRAGTMILLRYIFMYKLITLRQIVDRYAPASDGNNVNLYCSLLYKYYKGLCVNKNIDFVDRLTYLVFSFALVECSPRAYNYFLDNNFFAVVRESVEEYANGVLRYKYGTTDIEKIIAEL